MTDEEKKSNFRKLFAGIKIEGCSVVVAIVGQLINFTHNQVRFNLLNFSY